LYLLHNCAILRLIVRGLALFVNFLALVCRLHQRTAYVENYPGTIKTFLQAYQQVLDYVKAHHDAAVNLFVTHNKLSPQVAALTFSRREYFMGSPMPDFVADLADQSKQLYQLGIIQKNPDWSQFVDTTIARQALGS
jgi:ABC-type nitrate/sulfonate/bicarbonate transport system substrate-binding protein